MQLKKLFIIFLIGLAALASVSTGLFAADNKIDLDSLKIPEMPKLIMPEIQQFVLPNGLKVFLIEDHRLPLIELAGITHVSTLYDPADKVGLASVAGTVLRTGGTKNMTGDAIDLMLESLAAEIETNISEDYGFTYMSCLKDNFDDSLKILYEILTEPIFEQDKIDLALVEIKSGISRRNDQIQSIAQREFNSLIWGKDTPQGRYPEYDTVNAISRKDLLKFHDYYFKPNNMTIGIVGDFDSKEMRKKIEDTFAGWKSAEVNLPKIECRDKTVPAVAYVYKEDTNQSNVNIGFIAPKLQLNNPDYPAISVLNYIVGQAPGISRIFKEVRTTRGLAYNAYGMFVPEFEGPGMFFASCQTKLETTGEAIDAIISVLKDVKSGDISEQDFGLMKMSLLNKFVFRFDSNRKILMNILELDRNNYPLDYYQKYRDALEKVTVDDVKKAAEKYLDVSDLVILVVGQKDKFDKPLTSYGNVTELDITIPEPKSEEVAAATEETKKAGKALFKNVINVYGGEKALKANINRIEDYSVSITLPQGSIQMTSTVWSEYPYKQRREIISPMGKMIMLFDGEKGFQKMGPNEIPLKASEIAEMKKELKKELRWWVNNLDKLTIYTDGEAAIDGKSAIKIHVKEGDELLATLYIDKATNYIIKREYMGKNPMTGAPAMQHIYSYNFKKVDGILIPFKTVLKQDGKTIMETEITKIQINPKIDPKLFDKE